MLNRFVLLGLIASFNSFAESPTHKKILLNQVAKTFTLETDATTINQLKDKPWEAKKKQADEITIKVNDTIVFFNADNFVHNVYSSFFDLKTQEPGKSSEVLFNKEGTYEVQCAIHPKMKIKVKVTK